MSATSGTAVRKRANPPAPQTIRFGLDTACANGSIISTGMRVIEAYTLQSDFTGAAAVSYGSIILTGSVGTAGSLTVGMYDSAGAVITAVRRVRWIAIGTVVD